MEQDSRRRQKVSYGMSFSALGLCPELAQAIAAAKYATPTPVQMAAIPPILNAQDVQACAPTGSGKTLAFVAPMLQRLMGHAAASDRRVSSLVLTPTRELAMQVGEVFRSVARYLPRPIKVLTVFGGVSINPQMMALRGGADVLVATPGRLLDLSDRNAIPLGNVRTLVLDEADRLMDEGFIDELTRVLALLPERRQNLLFSATFPAGVTALARSLLNEPVQIDGAAGDATPPDIHQRAIAVDPERRTQLLRQLLQQHSWDRTLVFVATKYATEHVALKLQRLGFAARALHGDLSQGARTQALADFKAGRLGVLIATDIAARGIDVLDLSAVVNFDLPRSPADYVHRIGRTGRAGARGVSVSFVSPATEAHFRVIEKRMRLRLERETVDGFEPRTSTVAR
jgi:ATP-dependent RNA helicase RhlE